MADELGSVADELANRIAAQAVVAAHGEVALARIFVEKAHVARGHHAEDPRQHGRGQGGATVDELIGHLVARHASFPRAAHALQSAPPVCGKIERSLK